VYIHALGTPSSLHSKGVTQEDIDIYEAGGDITIYLIASTADDTQAQERADIHGVRTADGKSHHFDFDLSAYKSAIDKDGDTEYQGTKLDELNGLVKVHLLLDAEHRGHSDYAVYRHHSGLVEKILEGYENRNADSEYFEMSPDGTEIILFVKKFSVYAVAYVRSTNLNGQPATDTDSASLPRLQPAIDPELLNTIDHFAYIIGHPDGRIGPEDMLTREEAATIFFRLLKDDVRGDNLTSDNDFSDMKDTLWSNIAISTLAKTGIILGYPDGSYGPGDNITRAEFVTIVTRFFSYDDVSHVMPYSDVAADHWAARYIMRAHYAGLIIGDPGGAFRPDEPISRAEAIAIINRLLNRHVETIDDMLPDMKKWVDNADPGIWYYYEVQEASNSHDYVRKADGWCEKWEAILPNRDWRVLEQIIEQI